MLTLAAREVFALMLETDLAAASDPFAEEELDVTSMGGTCRANLRGHNPALYGRVRRTGRIENA